MTDSTENFAKLIDVMKRLRAPNGCPWDRKQTIDSLRPHIIEEAYELVDAIEQQKESGDWSHVLEECGDLLLQVIFVGTIAEENGDFAMSDIPKVITEKLIRRHPFIFDTSAQTIAADDPDKALAGWEEIKKRERQNRREDTSVLSGVPRNLPAVTKAYRIQQKTAGVGFDWEKGNQDGIVAKIREEIDEVAVELAKKENTNALAAEIGDLLFAVINLARRSGIDPDGALGLTNAKFERRFRFIEQEVEKGGLNWHEITLKDLESFWNRAKNSGL